MNKKRSIERIAETLKDPYSLISSPPLDICTSESHKKKRNCRNNPWCVYGLGELKEGIWVEKNPSLLSKLGTDVQELARKTTTTLFPVGLTNLGATCYINVLMQSLFHNLVVRDAVFNIVIAEDKALTHMDRIVMSLQEAFGHMQSSAMNAFSLNDFTSLLRINRGEQQDPLEFSKLFLAKLEDLKSDSVSGCSVLSLSQLLHGKQEYVTECLACRNCSRRDVDFTELELHIEDSESVEMSLESYFAQETITGENQYLCSSCNRLNDALRYSTLPSTPPVLFVQLLRYVYNRKTFEKVKLKDRIRFQDIMVVNHERFKLVSLMYHIGSSAYGGHYVADVISWSDQQWWHCDDDVVIPIGAPADLCEQEEQKKANAAQAKAGGKKRSQNRVKRTVASESNSNTVDLTGHEHKDSGGGSSSQKIVNESSKNSSHHVNLNRQRDVYMLAYVKEELFAACVGKSRVPMPARVQDAVNESSRLFQSDLALYQQKRNALMTEIEKRKQVYLNIRDELIPSGPRPVEGRFHIVQTAWLKSWIIGERQDDLPPQNITPVQDLSQDDAVPSSGMSTQDVAIFNEGVDNAACACPHGALDPSKAWLTKVVSTDAYLAMTEGSLCGICFDDKTFRCSDCFDDTLDSREKLRSRVDRYDELIDLLNRDRDFQPRNQSDGYVVSKKWIASFKTYVEHLRRLQKQVGDSGRSNRTKKSKAVEAFAKPCVDEASAGAVAFGDKINQDLYCREHGELSPSYVRESRRVSEQTWKNLIDEFSDGVPIVGSGSPCMRCQELSNAVEETQRAERSVRRTPLELSKSLKRLAERSKPLSPVISAVNLHQSFYLVDGKWLAKWRAYVDDIISPHPGRLSNDCLSCAHALPLIPTHVRAKFSSMESFTDVPKTEDAFGYIDSEAIVEIVSEDEWKALITYYRESSEEELSGQLMTREVSVSVQVGEWVWSPQFCLVCAREADRRLEDERIAFNDSVVNVVFLDDPVQQKQRQQESGEANKISWDEEDSDFGGADGGVKKFSAEKAATAEELSKLASGNRRSSRRRTSRLKLRKIVASCTDTLHLLQLKIYQIDENAKPNKQILYFKGEKMEALQKTLAEYGVKANDTIHVTISDQTQDAEYYWNELGVQASERGFAGTFLGEEPPSSSGPRSSVTCDSSSGSRSASAQHKPVIIAVEDIPSPGGMFTANTVPSHCGRGEEMYIV